MSRWWQDRMSVKRYQRKKLRAFYAAIGAERAEIVADVHARLVDRVTGREHWAPILITDIPPITKTQHNLYGR